MSATTMIALALIVLLVSVLYTGPPSPSPRPTPSGFKMPDGYSATITFSLGGSIGLWERSVKPPAVDGGELIDTSTMHNTAFHTGHPRTLKKVTTGTATCAYDPNSLGAISSMVNIPQVITYTFRDGATMAYYGVLQKFEPSDLKEGEFPEGTATIASTNADSTGAEQAPVFTAGSGT